MDRYLELRARAAEFVAEWVQWGAVLVLAPVREAADEVALEACGDALMGVRRLAFREFVLELSAAELNRRALVPVGRFVREALAARVTAEALGAASSPTSAGRRLSRVSARIDRDLRRAAPQRRGARPSARLRRIGRRPRAPARRLSRASLPRAASPTTPRASTWRALRRRARLRQTAVVALDLAPRTPLGARAARLRTGRGARPARSALAPGGAAAATSLESLAALSLLRRRGPAARRRMAASSSSPPPAKRWSAWRSRAPSAPPRPRACRSTRWPSCCALRSATSRSSWKRFAAPEFRSHCTRGARRPDVAGRSLLALLHCAEEGLSASRFAEYLSLGQVPEDEEPATPALWERLLVDAAVIGGLVALGNAPRRSARGISPAPRRRRGRRRRARALAAAHRRPWRISRACALPVIGRLAALPARALWGEWIAALIGSGGVRVARARERRRVAGRAGADVGDRPGVARAKFCWCWVRALNSLAAAPKESRFGKVWLGRWKRRAAWRSAACSCPV